MLHLIQVGANVDSSKRRFAVRVFLKGLSIKTDTRVSKVLRKRRLNSTTKTKRDPRQGVNDLGIFEAVSSRSKSEREYRKYTGLYM